MKEKSFHVRNVHTCKYGQCSYTSSSNSGGNKTRKMCANFTLCSSIFYTSKTKL